MLRNKSHMFARKIFGIEASYMLIITAYVALLQEYAISAYSRKCFKSPAYLLNWNKSCWRLSEGKGRSYRSQHYVVLHDIKTIAVTCKSTNSLIFFKNFFKFLYI